MPNETRQTNRTTRKVTITRKHLAVANTPSQSEYIVQLYGDPSGALAMIDNKRTFYTLEPALQFAEGWLENGTTSTLVHLIAAWSGKAEDETPLCGAPRIFGCLTIHHRAVTCFVCRETFIPRQAHLSQETKT